MRIAPAITLNPEQRTLLESQARSRSLPVRVAERARIVLLAASGQSDKEIAAGMAITEHELQQFLARRFREVGLVTDHDPIVGANEHAGDPHYAPPAQGSSKLKREAMLVIMRKASSLETASLAPITRPPSVRRVVAEYMVRKGLNGFSASFRSRPNMWSVLMATSTPASRQVRSPMKCARRCWPRLSASASASL